MPTHTISDFEDAFASNPTPDVVPTAVVMTMGALHEGHASLFRAAREHVGRHGRVAATIFVNPLQFGAGEDLDTYPRTLDADLKVCDAEGVDVVFAPSVDEMYPGGRPEVRITAGAMGERYEGASRPGHFDGMLTVVAKLLHIVAPDAAFFGQKDAQQLALIRRMTADLNLDVEIIGVPTVREPDGLALSSRNRYLSQQERQTALALSRALFAGRDAGRPAAWANGPADPRVPARVADPQAVRAAARAVLDEAARLDPPLALDYVALIDPRDFTEIQPAGPSRTDGGAGGVRGGTGDRPPGDSSTDAAPDHTDHAGPAGPAVLAVAAKVGTTRLIDNIPLEFGARP